MIKDIIIYLSAFVGVFAVSYYFLSLRALKKYEKQRDFDEDELPMVSIIIPAYNEEKTIQKTIKSALNLQYPREKLEVFVIDDGSKDSTHRLACEIKDSRLKIWVLNAQIARVSFLRLLGYLI